MAELKSTNPFSTPLATELLVPRLGEYLVEKNLITGSQLKQALQYQEEQRRAGLPMLLGQALVELKMVSSVDLDTSMAEQIIQYQMALQEQNAQLEQRVAQRTAELQHALNQLNQANQLKSNFIANISHELRTPLTHIKGYLELIASASLGPLSSAQHNAMQVILRSTERLERLIQDLIQFSLVEKGEFTLNCTPVDLDVLIQNIANKFSKAIHDKNLNLTLNLLEQRTLVTCDEEKISWVLIQLLDNAIKFTPADGQIVISEVADTPLVRISVKDTGIGIAPERIPELFEAFHQLDGSATRRYGGTGLGLALVKQIIEAHGSIITVTSEPGKGACFEFGLPVAESVV